MKFILTLILIPTISFAKEFVPSTFSASYEETIISLATKKERKSTGVIDYKYPGNIRFETLKPNPLTFVSNPEKTWHYQPSFSPKEPGQVTVQKSSDWPLIKVLDSLKNGVEGSKLFTYKYNKNELVLTFVDSIQKEINVKQVVLTSSKDAKSITVMNEFDKLTMIKMDNQKVHLRFTDFKGNVSFSPLHFIFEIPKNTKVINN